MSTIIYKKDEAGNTIEERCEASQLTARLSMGYVVNPEELDPDQLDDIDRKIEALEEELEGLMTRKEEKEKEIIGNTEGRWEGVTNPEVRELAKKSNLENWETGRIATLKVSIDELEKE